MLKDELVFDRLAGFSLRTKYESLKKDTAEVEAHVRQLMECMESLTRLQQRYENVFRFMYCALRLHFNGHEFIYCMRMRGSIMHKHLWYLTLLQINVACVSFMRPIYGVCRLL